MMNSHDRGHRPFNLATRRRGLIVLAILLLFSQAVPCTLRADEGLSGWQGMRIVKQEGAPSRMFAADLAGSGRQQLVVINTRMSRLDIYRWLPSADRMTPSASDADRPNDLPGAADWKRTELSLDELPADALARDIDGDGKPELVILTSPSNKVLLYKTVAGDAAGTEWKKADHWDLLPGAPSGKRDLLLLRESSPGVFELFVSCEQGIQTVKLQHGARAAWLSPRERRGRLEWRFVDLDGDGDQDLWEYSQQPKQTIRWHENRDGKLMSAQTLYEQSVAGARALPVRSAPAELLLLGGVQEGLLRRYVLGRGEESELGRQESLPMPGGPKALWTGIQLAGKPALVAVDSGQPKLRVQPVGDLGWQAEETFPLISGVRGLAAPHAQPGKLLLWVKDGTDLYTSVWENNRMTYPVAMPQSADVADRTILALGSTGTTTWWVQRVGADLDLYVWEQQQMEATRTRFTGQGTKAEKVIWLGGKRVLVQPSYSNTLKVVSLDDAGKVGVREPANLVKVDLGEFGIYNYGGQPRLGRLTDGVLQWLNEDMQPTDQVMLPEGQKIASFVPLADGTAWALEQGGAFVHQLKPDDAGILRVKDSIKPPGGSQLLYDAVLGLMLVDQDSVIRLGKGRPWELTLKDSFDGRVGRPSGVKEPAIHRITTTDVTGDGQEDVILFDDARHQITVLGRGEKGLVALGSWKVFDDRTYPYGGKEEQQVAEPRTIIGFDADGDHAQDLALLCQDRLIIYVARETN